MTKGADFCIRITLFSPTLLFSSKMEETAHQLSSLDTPAALFFARSAHHDVQALLQFGKVAGTVLHSQISCPQATPLEFIDLRVFFIGCMLMSGFAMVTPPPPLLPSSSASSPCWRAKRVAVCLRHSTHDKTSI